MGMKLISKKELANLLRASIKLNCLEAGGVDNWTWYDEALSDYDYIDYIDDNTLTEEYETYETD